MTLDLGVNGIASGAFYAMVALGFALIYRPTGHLHIAYGSVAVFSGYVFVDATARYGLSLVPAFVVTLAIAALVAPLLERVFYRGLGHNELAVLLTSFGLVLAIENLFLLRWGPSILYSTVGFDGSVLEIGPASISRVRAALVVAAVVVVGLTTFVVRCTRLGRALRAMAVDPEMALITGIPVRRLTSVSYLIGSVIAAAAVVLSTIDVGVRTGGGIDIVLLAFVGSVLFGDRVLAAALGGFVLGMVTSLGLIYVPSDLQTLYTYLGLVVVLFLRAKAPQLLVQAVRRIIRRRRKVGSALPAGPVEAVAPRFEEVTS